MAKFYSTDSVIEATRVTKKETISDGGLFMEGEPGWWRIIDGDAEFFFPHDEFISLFKPLDKEGKALVLMKFGEK